MYPSRTTSIVLVMMGVLGLAYGGFTYTRATHDADFGPVRISGVEKEHVNIPLWIGVSAIVMGGLLFYFGSRRL